MCKKDKHIEQTDPIMEAQYPRYLSNQPQGEDLFESKSQERLADAIAMHIEETDKVEEPVFARLVALEGKWGSGKSNVIKVLANKLKDKYTFFTFDAWGNQEDLQRRSILELLTRFLIDKGKLTGKTKMRVLKSDEGKVVEDECSWDEKLESLLSRKSFTRNVTVPSVNGWTKTFVLMLLITGMLIPLVDLISQDLSWKWYWHWWINLIIVILPILTFIIIAWCKGKLADMWKMYNTEGRSDTTSYVVSEREPSVREFKGWMMEISKGIPEGEKLVIVFDNMDRLPSEKVHQFWSLIQTFFADDGYENVWCVVPYDEGHLASVSSEAEKEDDRITLLKAFLNKTFPVVYRVPDPIVSDYKHLFETFFRQAFETTVDDNSLDLISQCYRHAHPVSNVREIISFINNNVLLAKQWKSIISPISRAVYVLKSDSILRGTMMTIFDGRKEVTKRVGTDEYILTDGYYMDFGMILVGNVSRSDMRREIAAMVYDIDPSDAEQIVVKRYIRNSINGGIEDAHLAKYADNPLFMSLLQDEVFSMNASDYERAVSLIKEMDDVEMSESDRNQLAKIWNFIANRYLIWNTKVTEYSDHERAIFSHVNTGLAQSCVSCFCQRLISNKDVNGKQLYLQLSKLFNDDFAKEFDVAKLCHSSSVGAERFAEYAKEAGVDYKRFPISTDPEELNIFIEQSTDNVFTYFDVLNLLKNDSNYVVSEVGEYAIREIDQKKANAWVVSNLISVQRLFYSKFQNELDKSYINSLWQEAKTDPTGAPYKEIYTLKAISTNESLFYDEEHINTLMDRVFFYTTTKQLIADFSPNSNIKLRNALLKKMILECRHDSTPDYPNFIEKWPALVNTLGLGREVVVRFADSWGYKNISEQEKVKPYFTLLGDNTWIETLKKEDTPLARELLAKCVNDMAMQPISQYMQNDTVNHAASKWDQALQKLVSTDYLAPDSFIIISDIAIRLLDHAAKNGPIKDVTWNSLLEKVSYSLISSRFSEIRNNILNGKSAYTMTPAKFRFLHGWLEQAEINADSHCTDAANQILEKVVNDTNCQAIILAKKEYYRPILANTFETASTLHEQLKQIVKNQGESEFAKYIKETLHY